MRYIAKKHDLIGKTPEEQTRVDLAQEECMDFRNGFTSLCYRNWVRFSFTKFPFPIDMSLL